MFTILIPKIDFAQENPDSSKLTIDKIFQSGEFYGEFFRQPRWIDDGKAYTAIEPSEAIVGARDIVSFVTKNGERSILVSAAQLIPENETEPLEISNYEWSSNKEMLLLFTNTKRVWRYNTKGDYWILNLKTNSLKRLGKGLPASSLMFAKFSPDDTRVAYVSQHNLYLEDLSGGQITQLTFDGTEDMINGTFDWAYEEEFFCRDGFSWSPDGRMIAYWQIDASGIKDFLMINNTDSLYSFTIPVEYPKVGEDPSSARIGVVPAAGGETMWMKIDGDPKQHYLVRMLWSEDSEGLLVQQLNRKQNTNKVWYCKPASGLAMNVFTDTDKAWVDIVEDWMWVDDHHFTWLSEKDGWRHLYLISKTGDEELLITRGNYDVVSIAEIDPNSKYAYFIASPGKPTQRYLYSVRMDGKSEAERITPEKQSGTHEYNVSPGGKYAFHTWSDINTPPVTELVSLPKHKTLRTLVDNENLKQTMTNLNLLPIGFFQVSTVDDVTMEGFMIKPPGFDPAKKYPVLFYVYGEPWGQTATDEWGAASLWHKMMAQEGYLVISMDNRGTPAPKGREWRKSIYRKIGIINSRDQAMAAREIMKWDFVDPDRTAVWGWSGGGSMTLNLMFRYPEIYETGMAVAPVSNQFFYDNIYQERYMGLKNENPEDFLEGSPVSYAKNLEGNLLVMHGTGDDNVHYQNTEVLINELIKQNKIFQVMPYPNRSHGIYEGENTSRHVFTMLRHYLMQHMEPGGK
ncbi:MAG: DPP IV N-terminal domain-containing protein [Bacteroidales bacterium]|nr:DPP IV N-terminal domain-containing protein [Bacteroidales bacterium]